MSGPMKLVDKIENLRKNMEFYTDCIEKQQKIIANYERDMKNAQSKEAKDRINKVQIEPEKATLRIYRNTQKKLYGELRIVEYLALEQQEKESDASRIVGPPVKIRNNLFKKRTGNLARFGNTQGWIAGRKEEILRYLINEELKRMKNELKEKVHDNTRDYWKDKEISQEELEEEIKTNYESALKKWMENEVDLNEIKDKVLENINIYESTNILSNTFERPKEAEVAKLTPANPENNAFLDKVTKAQSISQGGKQPPIQPPKQSTTIETR